MTTLVVIAKEPRPGRVKTRLTPTFLPAEAAALAAAALADTLAAVAAASARRRVLLLDGSPGAWVPPGFDVVRQVHGPLDVRIAGGLAAISGPLLMVGMDTPQLTPAHLEVPWAAHDAWFGAAADGGFWALGLARPDPALVLGVPMSRPGTGAVQLARLQLAGLRVGMLPVLRDVDTAADAAEVAAEAPATRFAALHALLAARPADDGCRPDPRLAR